MKSYRYFLAFILPITTCAALFYQGIWSYSTLLLAFVIIPGLELLTQPDLSGPRSSEEEESILQERVYDALLYAMVPVHYAVLFWFLWIMTDALDSFTRVGLILSMGVQCGAVGINVAHELGHRTTVFERFLARTLLLSSLYMHFIVEHNRGHHKHVATPLDPASARLNESIYCFWIRTIAGSFSSAWRIESQQQVRSGRKAWNLKNEMIRLVIIESVFLLGIFMIFNLKALFAFIIVAFIGILLLETVNYIEHYGLCRKQLEDGRYERVQPWHSWNSDYPLGRIILFELTRHSDHHYKSSRKYPVLRHFNESPQLPTGYPGMMLLSLIPPLWFRMINPLVAKANRLR